jgi:hypothetical protein
MNQASNVFSWVSPIIAGIGGAGLLTINIAAKDIPVVGVILFIISGVLFITGLVSMLVIFHYERKVTMGAKEL